MAIRNSINHRRCLGVAAVFVLAGMAGCSSGDDAAQKLIGTWTAQVEARFADSKTSNGDQPASALIRIAYRFKYNDDLEVINEVAGQAVTTRLKWKVSDVQGNRVTIQTRTRGDGAASKLVGEIILEFADDDHFTRAPVEPNGLTATFKRFRER